MRDLMRCVSCNRDHQYPDGFPRAHSAECWECAWADHISKEHPKVVKKIRAAALKRFKAKAAVVTDADLLDHAFGIDRRVLASTFRPAAPSEKTE